MRSPRAGMLSLALALVAGGACEKKDATPDPLSTPAPSAAPVTLPAARPDAAVAVVDAGNPAPDAGGPAAAGDWIEGDSYSFRLDGVRACDKGKGVGLAVRIKAKAGELPVSPRDLTLESKGVILRGEFPGPAPLPGCTPALAIKQLAKGESASGVVVFVIPDGWAPAPGSLKLAYKPTRWGGARRVEVSVRECLASCADAKPKTKAKSKPITTQAEAASRSP